MTGRSLLRLLGFYGAMLLVERVASVRTRPASGPATSPATTGDAGSTVDRGTATVARSSGGDRDRDRDGTDRAPGEREEHETDIAAGLRTYGIGLGLALFLTGLSFFVAGGFSFVWQPAVPIALVVLAVAQIGVHLVFFLHLTTGPDNTNNVLALAFGTLIVFLILAGTLWIMANLNHNMMPPEHMSAMQR